MRRSVFVFGALFLGGALHYAVSASAQSSGDPDVDKRLQRLEEQIVDLNAQLGTIETMTQGSGSIGMPSAGAPNAGGTGFAGGGGSDSRLLELETQLRALSSQFSDVLSRLERIEQRAGLASPQRQGAADINDGGLSLAPSDSQPAEQGTGFSVGGNQSGAQGFGTTIESDGTGGDTGGGGGLSSFFSSGSEASAPSAITNPQPIQTAAQSSNEAQSLYSTGYNALLQRDYRTAANTFEKFVQAHPKDPLAGQAHHWLGEAAFINGEYRTAANSFLKSSTNYPQNEKAAESLLKLGISLKRLGENQAACSSFAELGRRFPNATQVLERASRERQRTDC